jgi:hypothetical protein
LQLHGVVASGVWAFFVLAEHDEGSLIRYRVRLLAPGLIAKAPCSHDHAHVVFFVYMSMLALPANSGHDSMLGDTRVEGRRVVWGVASLEAIGQQMS